MKDRMRSVGLVFWMRPLLSSPLSAQEQGALEMVTEGWGRGPWIAVRSVGLNPDSDAFEEVDDSPWSTWEVRHISPTWVEHETSDRTARRPFSYFLQAAIQEQRLESPGQRTCPSGSP